MNYVKIILTILIINVSISTTFGQDQQRDQSFYNELLKKHQDHGQINESEVKKQQFQISNQQKWQENFKKQVRGVASSIQISRDKIELNNPAIEISVK